MADEAISTADRMIENIRTTWVKIETTSSYHQTFDENMRTLRESIDGYTRSKSANDDKQVTWALKVIQLYTWFATEGYIHETGSLQGNRDYWRSRAEEAEEDKEKLKKENIELSEKYFRADERFNYVNSEFKKLLAQLAESYKEAHR